MLYSDVKSKINNTLPQSILHQLEDSFPLPLGCELVTS
jgi:hypothetical protein